MIRSYYKMTFFFYLLSPVSCLLSLALFTSCETDIETINTIASTKEFPVESGKNVEIKFSDSAKIKLKLVAVRLDRYEGKKQYIELPAGVKIDFYDDSMKVSSKLTADYAIRYEGEKKMEAKKNVVVVNKKGEQLNTEHLTWDEEKHTISSDAFVRITTAKEIIFGDGLESNEDFTKYKIKNIKGTINMDEKE